MKDELSIVQVNYGTSQYLELKVLMNCNLEFWAIVDRTFDSVGQTNTHRHFINLPNLDVKAGEYIHVYTGDGKYAFIDGTVKSTGAKVKIHKIYAGMGANIWNETKPANTTEHARLIKICHEIERQV